MGIFDNVKIEEGVKLPEYPHDPTAPVWQTKTIGSPMMETYRITADGRLERKQTEYRDMTSDERDELAQERTDGEAQTWDEWEELDEPIGPLETWARVVEDEWWVDHNQHGSFEFHHVVKDNPVGEFETPGQADWETNVYYSYEARFTRGDLDEIVLLKEKDLNE